MRSRRHARALHRRPLVVLGALAILGLVLILSAAVAPEVPADEASPEELIARANAAFEERFNATAETESNIFLRGAELPRPVLNIAHRGAASLAPENTIAAARRAWELGADLWGIDVRLTKDGVFILMHDKSLKRTTNVEELFPSRSPLVRDFTLAEIEELDAGSWFVRTDPFGQIRAGDVSSQDQQSYIGEKVPTLREALEFTRESDWRVDIEVKQMGYFSREEIAQKLVSLIKETGTGRRVMVSSFDHDFLKEVKRLDSNIPIAALVIFAPRAPGEYLEGLGADAYDPSPLAFSPRVAAELRELGYGVYIWTYNKVNQLETFAAMAGVSGIYTDFPQRLEPILDELFGPNESRGEPMCSPLVSGQTQRSAPTISDPRLNELRAFF